MMRIVKVLGVDPGIKNLSYFVGEFAIDEATGKVYLVHEIDWKNGVLVPGRYKLATARKKLTKFWNQLGGIFDIQVIAIEQQCKLRLLNLQRAIKASLKQLFPNAVFMKIMPSLVKRMFSISAGSHRANKKAAVGFVKGQGLMQSVQDETKLDDYADSLLTAFYAACQILKCEPKIISSKDEQKRDDGDGRPVIRDNSDSNHSCTACLLDEVTFQFSKLEF